MKPVIQVENIGKSYLIGHRQKKRSQTLRDVLSDAGRTLLRRTLHPFRTSPGQPWTGSDEVEEFWALRDVSFQVEPGERLGIIGRNGAGKSTLLKILSRITEPTEGRVTIRGRVASLLEVGTGFHPELTGRENIFLNGSILGMSKQEINTRFDEIVDFAGVEKFLDTPVKRYSSGMYVRLAFAVAAHLEPEILIVDEVLSVGDAEFQKKCIGKMQTAENSGRAVLFVSHNLPMVRHLCEKAILLDQGRIRSVGSADVVVDAYLAGQKNYPLNREITADMHQVPDPCLRILRVVGLDESGQAVERIMAGAPFSLRISYETFVTAHDLVIYLYLYNPAGVLVGLISSEDAGSPLPAVPGREHSIDVRLENDLIPGPYSVIIKVKRGKEFVDRIEGLSLPIVEMPGGRMAARGGIVCLKADWRLGTLEQGSGTR